VFPKGLPPVTTSPCSPDWNAWDPKEMVKPRCAAAGLFYNPIEQLVLEQFQAEPPFGGSSLLSEGLFSTPFVFKMEPWLPIL